MKFVFVLVAMAFCHISFSQDIRKMKIGELNRFIDSVHSPLIVNFWASWCKPCVHEIPWFEKCVNEYKEKGIVLVLVSLDFGRDFPTGISNFAKQQGYTSRIIFLDEKNADYFCPLIDKSWDGSIPVSLFVNSNKKYKRFYNQQLPEPQLRIAINELVEPAKITSN